MTPPTRLINLLLLLAYGQSSLKGAASAWNPYYVGQQTHSHGRPQSSYTSPQSGYGAPPAAHGSHSGPFSGQSQHGGWQGGHAGDGYGTADHHHHHQHSHHKPGHYQPHPQKPYACATFLACQDDRQCPAGQFCEASPHLPHCGQECLPDRPEGDGCQRDHQCRSNHCDPDTRRCRLRPSPPNPCAGFVTCGGDRECPVSRYCSESPHLPQCGSECLPDLPNTYSCDRDHQCRSGFCSAETAQCQTRPSPPDPCKGFMSCDGDQACPVSRHCSESPHLPECGRECVPDLPNTYDCNRDHQCRSGYCHPQGYQCQMRPSPPDPCKGFMACDGDRDCPVSRFCGESPYLTQCGRECLPDRPDTFACDRDAQCRSDFCEPGSDQCRPRPSPPDPCAGFAACAGDQSCNVNQHCAASPLRPACGAECVPDLPLLASCQRAEQCLSGHCDTQGFFCRPPPGPCDGVLSCESDEGCAAAQHCSPSPALPQCGLQCQPDYADMTEPCNRDEQCESGFCDPAAGRCKSPPCAGFAACAGDFSCALAEFCGPSPTRPGCGRECQPDLPDAASCARSDQCLSNFCEPGAQQCGARPITPEPCCQFGFTRLGDACYELQETPADFDSARAACRNLYGGDLTAVPDQQVNDLVAGLLAERGVPSAWVGVTDRRAEGEFEDVAGAEQTFASWAGDRPRVSTARNCVEIAGQGHSDSGDELGAGEWNDLDCGEQRTYVCQAPIQPICPKVPR